MRTSSKCIKCGSLAIGHLSRRFNTIGVDTKTQEGAGTLETFVCAECGYVETYVQEDPATVPFDGLKGFRWVNEPNPQRGTFR